MRNKFVEREFVNEFGQLMKPGDPVIFVTTGAHVTGVNQGLFEGVNVNEKDEITSVRVRYTPKYDWDRGCVALPLKRVFKFVA